MDRLARRRPRDEGGGGLSFAEAFATAAIFDANASGMRLRVTGVVQGVGFRPFVHRLATELGLTGSVINDGRGVVIDLHGAAVGEFRARLMREAPPLARIERVTAQPLPGDAPSEFAIRETPAVAAAGAAIPADVAPCAACLAEMRDPTDRRFGYVFTSCTDCGPRWSITCALPFDRAATAMAAFPMCDACDGEYRDPASRRFHAQTNCCPDCGPRLSHDVATIAETIRAGGVVALKGIGGFHLACDATNETAVARLRGAKRREAKPFAVLVGDLDTARHVALVGDKEADALASSSRPIVIVAARPGAAPRPADAVSGGLSTLGLMLPSSLLQAALIDVLPPGAMLVMTSGNRSGEPVIIDDEAARRDLVAIADLVVTHDRAIIARADDSVIRVVDGAARLARRGRGAAPSPIRLADDGPDVLALGGHLKSAACVLVGRQAILSPHVGDLDHPDAVVALETAARHLVALTGARPRAIACDRHPDFASTRLAERFGLPVIAVQHHHAHALAVAAEARHDGPFLAITLDGFGLGDSREAWGGEILDVDGGRFERVAHLGAIPEPGGDVAAREPWRIAAALLAATGQGATIAARFAAEPQANAVAAFLVNTPRLPMTTSAGRWFDAAAALLGVATRNHFEGEAAMRLEALAAAPAALPGGWARDGLAIDLLPLVRRLASERDAARGANLFHGTLIEALTETAASEASRLGRRAVALGGGCFLNRVLTEGLASALRERGLKVLIARDAPTNDGGLALGQAIAARHLLGDH